MKGFIEVTNASFGRRNLINITNIEFVSARLDGKGETDITIKTFPSPSGEREIDFVNVAVKESYDEVIKKIEEALK